MRLHPLFVGMLALSIFVATIVTAQATGNWSVSGKTTATGEKIAVTGTNPDEIKGWMTLEEITNAYKVSLEDVLKAFDLPPDTPPSKQVKDLESDKFSPTNLRTWLKNRAVSP